MVLRSHSIANPWIGGGGGAGTAALVQGTGFEKIAFTSYRRTPVVLHAGRLYFGGVLTLPICTSESCPGCEAPLAITGIFAAPRSSSGIPTTDLYGNFFMCVNGASCGIAATTPPAPHPQPAATFQSLRDRVGTSSTAANVCQPVPVHRGSWGELKLIYR